MQTLPSLPEGIQRLLIQSHLRWWSSRLVWLYSKRPEQDRAHDCQKDCDNDRQQKDRESHDRQNFFKT